MKKIGILGGMGPQASLHFYEMLIEKTKEKFSSPKNENYPFIMLSNIPVRDLIESESDKEKTIQMVSNEANALEGGGVDFLVMTCNTMHLFQKEITSSLSVPFISMIDCVVEKIQTNGYKKIGLLGSKTTLQSKLYQKPLEEIGVEVLIPSEKKQNEIATIICKYISGNITEFDTKKIELYCEELYNTGVEAILLGCTELPLITQGFPGKYNFLSSTEILATRSIEECYT